MPNENTIKEFLVGLGFDIDEASWSKFTGGIARATKQVTALGAETVATGLAISAMVEKTARNYEELYYVAQRSGASIAGLKANEYGWRQVGLSAGQARSTIESVAQTIRTNPGLRGLMQSFGIDPNNAERAATQFVETLKRRFGERGYFVAAQFAQMYGIDETAFRTLWINIDRLKAAQKEHQAMMRDAGLDADQAGEDFRKFANAVDRTWGRFGALTDRISHDFLPAVHGGINALGRLLILFSRFNDSKGGVPGMAATIGASGLGILMIKSLIWRILGLGGGAAAAGAAGAGLGAGVLGAGAGVGVGAGGAAAGAAGLGAFMRGGLGAMLRRFGVPAAMLAMMKYDEGNSTRTFLRGILGIDETDEERRAPAPWNGGQWPGGPHSMPFDARNLNSAGAGYGINNPVLNQKTEINLLGSASTFENAQAIFGSQDSINSNLVRYWGRSFGEVRP